MKKKLVMKFTDDSSVTFQSSNSSEVVIVFAPQQREHVRFVPADEFPFLNLKKGSHSSTSIPRILFDL